jgi:predicted enzyme related to lactoylglutathione lyase
VKGEAHGCQFDESGRSFRDAGPTTPGAINGGFYPEKEDWPAQYPSVVVAVDDITASMKKVEAAGGKLLGEPMEIPGYGLYVSFFDTEGNRVSMMQPHETEKKKAK